MISFHQRVGFGGFIKLKASKLDGSSRDVTGWFPNLITDPGLNRMGIGSYMDACLVGSGNATPTVLDTGLNNFVFGTTNVQNTIMGAQGTPPYYAFYRRTWRFTPGQVTGNLSEVAIGWSSTNTNIFSRALIKDEFGDPTVVTILADEFLDVTYELRAYPPLDDTAPVNRTVEGVSTAFVFRASLVTNPQYWAPQNGQVGGLIISNSPQQAVNSGAIAAITASPSGSSSSRSTLTAVAYSNNSLSRSFTAFWELNIANFAGGIQSVFFGTTIGTFQGSITPNINKTALKVLSMGFTVSWGRYAP